MIKKYNKKCNCWSCKLSSRIRKFERSLDAEKLVEFRTIFGEVWDRLESIETDLGVLNAKFEGTWPKNDENEEYYHRIGENLYIVKSTPISVTKVVMTK